MLRRDALLPLLRDLIDFVRTLTKAYFYEFEIQNSDLVVIENANQFTFMMVNQPIPLLYRRDFTQVYNEIYDEAEYELNDVLVLKKLAFLLVTLANGVEPENWQLVTQAVE